MPDSDHRFDERIKHWLQGLTGECKTFLDIGPGAGKYIDMLNQIHPQAIVHCVEADASYIPQYNLEARYHKVYNQQIEDWIKSFPDESFDVVILGDVLEHLFKSDGLDVLNFFVYRAKYILIVWPIGFIQYSWHGHVHENHRSLWGERDFTNFDYDFFEDGEMRMAIIRGLIP